MWNLISLPDLPSLESEDSISSRKVSPIYSRLHLLSAGMPRSRSFPISNTLLYGAQDCDFVSVVLALLLIKFEVGR